MNGRMSKYYRRLTTQLTGQDITKNGAVRLFYKHLKRRYTQGTIQSLDFGALAEYVGSKFEPVKFERIFSSKKAYENWLKMEGKEVFKTKKPLKDRNLLSILFSPGQ
jgi:hypothetical protein